MCIPRIRRVLSVSGEGLEKVAVTEQAGTAHTISLACVPSAQIGDHVSIHAGFALAVIPTALAKERIALIEQAKSM